MLTEENTTIKQRKNGFFEIRWTEWDGALERSVSRTHSCRTKDAGAASAYRRTWLGAERMVEAMIVDRTVDQLCDLYDDQHVAMSGITRSQMLSLRFVRRVFGPDVVGALSTIRFRAFTRDRLATGVVASTVRRELGALVAVLNWAVREGHLPSGTVLPYIPKPPQAAGRERYLSQSEADRMFGLASTLGADVSVPWRQRRIGLFICLAMETAGRASAVEGLTWDRVDFGQNVIDLREPGRRISKKRRVSVPISDKLLPILRDAYAEGLGGGAAVVGPVLRSGATTRKAFETFIAKHGFDGVVRHDLRRTWATLRAQRGVSLFDIAGVLGDSYETVVKHYAHHAPDHLRSAVNG
jgi:integrase